MCLESSAFKEGKLSSCFLYCSLFIFLFVCTGCCCLNSQHQLYKGQEDRQLCIDSSMHEAEVAIPTETELNMFFDRLAESSTTVTTVPKYSDRFVNIPAPAEPNIPPVLSSLHDEKHRNLTESELTAKCQEVFDGLHISNSEALFLEMSTRKQSACLQWFNH